MFNNKIKRDMQFNTTSNRRLPFFVALGLMAVLTSCGSFQYAGYNNDGIYSDTYEAPVEEPVVMTSTDDSNYYKNYFSNNSADVSAAQEESEVFTDIDSYEGNYTDIDPNGVEQQPAYGGWGQNSDVVNINYINNGWGFNNFGYGGFNNFGFGGFGYGGFGLRFWTTFWL